MSDALTAEQKALVDAWAKAEGLEGIPLSETYRQWVALSLEYNARQR